jgi:hypothetical protein
LPATSSARQRGFPSKAIDRVATALGGLNDRIRTFAELRSLRTYT